jgi:O-antigen/teichoic acid export membrane protein
VAVSDELIPTPASAMVEGAGEKGPSDHRVLAAGTAQNIAGLVCFVIGTFGANVFVSRAFGGESSGATALGIVTLGTQFAYIAAAGTRFGMDMASVRYVAIEMGSGHPGRVRSVVARAVGIAAAISVAVGALTFLFAPNLAKALSDQASATNALRAAGIALPFVALTFVYLGATRGLKIMRHTLYVQWVGQPFLWIGFMVLAVAVGRKTVGAMVLAYALSWAVATGASLLFWRRERRRVAPVSEKAEADLTHMLTRYGAPRAPAALLSQALFWVDYFVASVYVPSKVSSAELGVYSACVRVALAMVLFLTAVSYVFSPFVADLHARGRREQLDKLFKAITRWTVAGTILVLLVMLIVPGPILRIFGGAEFVGGTTALRILLVGQAVNVSVGAAGFVLIMAGRTGWDLLVYALSFVLDLVLAIVLVSKFGIDGAAISQAVTITLSNALRLYLVWRYVGIHPYDRFYFRLIIPAVIAAVAMVGAAVVLHQAGWLIQLLGVGLAGTVVYIPAILVFGLTPQEKKVVMRTIKREPAAAGGGA